MVQVPTEFFPTSREEVESRRRNAVELDRVFNEAVRADLPLSEILARTQVPFDAAIATNQGRTEGQFQLRNPAERLIGRGPGTQFSRVEGFDEFGPAPTREQLLKLTPSQILGGGAVGLNRLTSLTRPAIGNNPFKSTAGSSNERAFLNVGVPAEFQKAQTRRKRLTGLLVIASIATVGIAGAFAAPAAAGGAGATGGAAGGVGAAGATDPIIAGLGTGGAAQTAAVGGTAGSFGAGHVAGATAAGGATGAGTASFLGRTTGDKVLNIAKAAALVAPLVSGGSAPPSLPTAGLISPSSTPATPPAPLTLPNPGSITPASVAVTPRTELLPQRLLDRTPDEIDEANRRERERQEASAASRALEERDLLRVLGTRDARVGATTQTRFTGPRTAIERLAGENRTFGGIRQRTV